MWNCSTSQDNRRLQQFRRLHRAAAGLLVAATETWKAGVYRGAATQRRGAAGSARPQPAISICAPYRTIDPGWERSALSAPAFAFGQRITW